jgi:hypothetical protein
VSEKLRILVLLMAAGVVLAGPFIYDNGLRAAWVTLGLAATIFSYRALRFVSSRNLSASRFALFGLRFRASPAYRRPDR